MAQPVLRARAVLLDIEGTVCPISFVKDVLFPYALRALPATLDQKWDSPDFAPYRSAFPDSYASSRAAFEAHVRDLVDRDVKAPYLKSLQGYLWKEGYAAGELKAPLFADVAPAISRWQTAGLAVMIYSSGSVPAQKLFFGHTDAQQSDLAPIISDWFDTVNAGPKMDPASYTKIATQHPEIAVPDWLFLSDNLKEVDAARAAGMQSLVVVRPGNAPVPSDHPLALSAIYDFTSLGDLTGGAI